MIINNLYLYIVIKDRFLMVRLFSHFWVKYYTLRHKPVYPKITLKSESLIRLIEHKICCLFLCSCLRLHCLPTIFFSQNFISLSESFIGLEYKKCCSSQCYMFVWKTMMSISGIEHSTAPFKILRNRHNWALRWMPNKTFSG